MNQGILLFWLSALLSHAPSLLATLVVCVALLARRERLGPAFPWALGGFGLLLLVALIAPSTQVVLQQWAVSHYTGAKEVGFAFTVASLFWSCLQALAFVFIAVALFKGRRGAGIGTPPSLPPQTVVR